MGLRNNKYSLWWSRRSEEENEQDLQGKKSQRVQGCGHCSLTITLSKRGMGFDLGEVSSAPHLKGLSLPHAGKEETR